MDISPTIHVIAPENILKSPQKVLFNFLKPITCQRKGYKVLLVLNYLSNTRAQTQKKEARKKVPAKHNIAQKKEKRAKIYIPAKIELSKPWRDAVFVRLRRSA